ncbi:MAG TPA: ATP-binding protein [Chitinophagaceae bacterium]|nr:ATP-binding protein [Chitinophagaceae bacterium]
MKRRIIQTVFYLFIANFIVAQQSYIDSLKNKISVCKNDTACMILFGKTADIYSEINPDSAYYYAEKMQAITKKLHLSLEESVALNQMGYALLNKGNQPRALQNILSSIAIGEDPASEKNLLPSTIEPIDEFSDRLVSPHMQRLTRLSRTQQYLGIVYQNATIYEKAISYYRLSLMLGEQTNNSRMLSITYATLGRTYLSLKQPDSALYYLQKAYDNAVLANYNRYIGSILLNIARVYAAEGNIEKAKEYFRRALAESEEHFYYRGVVASNLALAELSKNSGDIDSILYFVRNGLPVASYLNSPDLFMRSYTALADFYKLKGNNDSTVKYQSLIIKIKDSLFNSKNSQEFQNIDFEAQQRLQQVEAAKVAERAKLRTYALLTGLAVFLFIAIVLYRNSLQRKKANIFLSQQKNELETTLVTLKTTQNQLVQSEKMASLGELTAGIAHEIQNPLNFVNNFSEVNAELIDELRTELEKGNKQQAIEIAIDIKENEGKIIFHGKRADAIVKSMLQHSRSSAGKKELTNINVLADEYLRLAYHGMKAKEKSFNVDVKSDFDDSIPNINVIQQDIGRVILNLITNAFYAVSEKKQMRGDNYEPVVTVSTKTVKPPLGGLGAIEISVRDNGNGIPQKVLDKIFQPFFTTKPSGQGTGLGLSLSYDIITKGHSGELKVETKEGEGSVFIISLPVNNEK